MGPLTYTITANEKSVYAVSDFYIPFEPKSLRDDMQEKVLQLRQDIRNSIQNLNISEQEILLASYKESQKNRFYDVENMLFYNIGGTGFRKVSPKQLAFLGDEQRFFDSKETSVNTAAQFTYVYRAVNVRDVEALLEGKTVLATWLNAEIDETISKSPARYYAAIRQNSDLVTVTAHLCEKALFGLKIELTTPYGSHPAAVMKPMLDGVICAFHGETDHTADVLQEIFASQTDHLLSDSSRLNIFGPREYARKYRGAHSFVWNPEDERLQFAWIIVTEGQTPSISGTIYKW